MRLVWLILLWLAAPVAAETEVHVVSVATGWEAESDLWAVPTVPVHVDRPDQWVTLVLMDRGPVRWDITLAEGTRLDEIIVAGQAPRNSEVRFMGIPMDGLSELPMPVALAPRGSVFRDMVRTVADHQGVDRLSSFHGRYSGGAEGFAIDALQSERHLSVDPLAEVIVTDVGFLPDVWPAAAVETPQIDGHAIVWQNRRFEPPQDMPVLFPMDAVFDTAQDRLLLMTLGREGYVYDIDVDSGTWSVWAEQDGYDGAKMLLDERGQRLIMTGAFGRPGEIRSIGFDGAVTQFKVPVFDFPGLTDLYAYGRDRPVPLTPVAVVDNWLLVEAVRPETGAYRHYGVNLNTAAVRLVGYAG